MRMLPILSLLLLMIGLHRTGLAESPSVPKRPPNILLILCDDLGFSDIGCYGGEIATPSLDRLAHSGVRFHQFYNTARCWPTRAALLTGYYAQQVRRDQVEGLPSGGQGKRPEWAKLLPVRLQPMGYRSYHSGKWHLDGAPLQQGFDRSYSLQDHDRHFRPKLHTLQDKPLPPALEQDGYYSSTEIANRTLQQWEEHRAEHADAPFFSFVAFTAPHFPLQAPPDVVQRYVERYREGWDAVREKRWGRMASMGLGDHPASVEPDVGPPYAFPEAIEKLGAGEVTRPVLWSALTDEQREFQTHKMAVHAAMIECMDTEIGRLLSWLEEHQQLEDTLILFLSDNGASAEIMVRGDGHDPMAYPGSSDTFLCLGPGWSSVSNTPFRRHKTWVHEGGICTPFIAHWPAGIAANSIPIQSPCHVVDVVPTLLEVATSKGGISSPEWDGPKAPGESFASLFAVDGIPHSTDRILWWQHEGNRALRRGDWKIVAAGRRAAWELYNLRTDRAETKDLADENPELVAELSQVWQEILDANTAMAKGEPAP